MHWDYPYSAMFFLYANLKFEQNVITADLPVKTASFEFSFKFKKRRGDSDHNSGYTDVLRLYGCNVG